MASLKTKLLSAIALIYLLMGVAALVTLVYTTERIAEDLGSDFAIKHALWHRDRIVAPITREVTLSRKLADSPLVAQWLADENDGRIGAMAIAEMESHRRFFRERALFAASAATGNFHFRDGVNPSSSAPLSTLDPARPSDSWFFASLKAKEPFNINVNYDANLKTTKVWINARVESQGRVLGVVGTGLDLSAFLQDFIASPEEGVSAVLIDGDGAIRAHQNPEYISYNTVVTGGDRTLIFDLLATDRDRAAFRTALEKLAVSDDMTVETLYVQLGGQRYLAALSSLNEFGWYSVTLLDLGKVLAFKHFTPLAAVIVVTLLAVMLLTTGFLNRVVLHPLMRLTKSSQEIAAGEYAPLPVDRRDEIGRLTEAFNHMTATVRDYMQTLESKVRDRTVALSESNRKLEESARTITDSIAYARLIQSSLLPRSEILADHLNDHAVICRQRDVVGGDFYFMRGVENGFLLGVADCTGHGVPGAFMSMTAHAVLDQVIDNQVVDPATILGLINRIIRDTLHRTKHAGVRSGDAGQLDNGLDLALVRYCAQQGKLFFAGARISLWLESEGQMTELRGNRHSLGYRRSDPDFQFTTRSLDVDPDAIYWLLTDGLFDQAGGVKGLSFGKRRFVEAVSASAGQPLADRISDLERRLAEYAAGRPPRDDATVFAFRLGLPAQ